MIRAAATMLALLGPATTGVVRTAAVAQAPRAPQVSTPKHYVTPKHHYVPPKHYVALGDSYSAGPGIPEQRAEPLGCGRSTHNYPALIARTLHIRDYTDVSCSGARTDHMLAPQQGPLSGGGTNPPQFDALAAGTDLVTLTISGNDIGFTDMFDACFRLSASDPSGSPCQRQATAGGVDRYAQRIALAAPKVAAVLEGIRSRSPSATVLLVAYLRILPPELGCYPDFPIARGDVPYLDGLAQQLNAMLADQAFHHGAAFVNSYTRSLGHDTCQLPDEKWVEGTTPTRPAYPIHPNASGMQAVTMFALDTLSGLA
jgi:lysophospholipase L1-like esterase